MMATSTAVSGVHYWSSFASFKVSNLSPLSSMPANNRQSPYVDSPRLLADTNKTKLQLSKHPASANFNNHNGHDIKHIDFDLFHDKSTSYAFDQDHSVRYTIR